MLKVRLLGALTISVEDRVLSGLPKKAQALVAYLAADPGRLVSRERLSDLLWPDCTSDVGRHRLRSALLAVRNALGPDASGFISAEGDGLRVVQSSTWTDVMEFEHLAASKDRQELSAAADLYRGDFLSDLSTISPVFDEWAQVQRARLLEVTSSVLMRLSELRSEAGDHTGAISAAQRLVSLDRLSEEAHRTLMRAYANAGRQASALKQYRECVETLKAELGIAPSAETSLLAQRIGASAISLTAGQSHPSPETVRPDWPPMPDKPSIAILPFTNLSGDPEQEYFADGIVEDIITALGCIRWLFVIARNSSFTYKARTVDIRQVGRELGVRYVLEGSVRKAGDRVRISGQLVEAGTGRHIWSDKFDGRLEDIFELQDQVTEGIVGAIEPNLRLAEMERAQVKPTESLNAYDLCLRAMYLQYQGTEQSARTALSHLYGAMKLDPQYALPKGLAAYCLGCMVHEMWDEPDARRRSITLAREAIACGKSDPNALRMAGHMLGYFVEDFEGALAAIDRALVLNPNLAAAYASSGWVRVYVGQAEMAAQHLQRALRLSPLDPELYLVFSGLSTAFSLMAQHEEALAWAARCVREYPAWSTGHRMQITALVDLGRVQEAEAAGRRYMERYPDFRLSAYLARIPMQDRRWVDHFAQTLRVAGIPE